MAKYEAVVHFDEKSADVLTKIVSSKAELISVRIRDPIDSVIKSIEVGKRKRISSPIRGKDVLKGIMDDGQAHDTKEILQAFLKHGFERNSASPRILELVREGEIKRTAPGVYQKISRVKTTKT